MTTTTFRPLRLTSDRRFVLDLVRRHEIVSYWHNGAYRFEDHDSHAVTGIIKALVEMGLVATSYPHRRADVNITDRGIAALVDLHPDEED